MKHFCLMLTLLSDFGQCSNILGVFVYPSFSHQIVYRQITKELSLRGHKVTVVTPNPANDPTLTNLTEIDVHFVYDYLSKTSKLQEKYSIDISAVNVMNSVFNVLDLVAELELNSTQFRKLILDENQKFDLILIHFAHPVIYGLAARFRAPVISITTFDALAFYYDSVGNPNNPVLYPDFFFDFLPGRLTMWEKLESLYFFTWIKWYYHWVFLPRSHQMARRYIGNVPYIGDLEKNVSMLFVYRNILMEPPKPNVPAVVELSFITLEPSKPLPDDLQEHLDGATEGVVYISFGSNIKTTLLNETLKDCILETVTELPYKVLLKRDSDDSPKSPNVIVRKWYPQRDILAHPNVKVFITQGGLQSIEDAILSEVPMIGVPFMADQPKNIRRLVELGIGEELDRNSINRNEFKNFIIKVAEDMSYKEKIKTVRKVLLDKSKTGLESAVWWCEYVIRHKGAKHLRSSSIDMSYAHYFLLDVVSIVISVSLILFCILLRTKTRRLRH